MKKSLEITAVEALKELLQQVSAIKLRDIKFMSPDSAGESDILVHIDVYGHSHLLVCKVKSSGDLRPVRSALSKLKEYAGHVAGEITPILIAPQLSPEAQALCRESSAGFLDLQGNARIILDEVFFAKRSLPQRKPPASETSPLTGGESKPFAEVA
ncbi:MAG: hypothetical protein KGM96_14075 [Acidobacteriota bacterium]|nr:hypothetical protein [Acidobacteriota bacterium]